VNDLTLHLIVQRFEMRNLQGAHGLNGHGETLIGAATRLRSSEPLSRRSQDAKHLRPIESLTFTVITEAHVVPRLRKESGSSKLRCPHSTFDRDPAARIAGHG
jgi:hypothetical protein